MTLSIIRQGQVVLGKWGRPEDGDVAELQSAIHEARMSSGRAVTLIALVPPEAPAPDEALRKKMAATLKKCLVDCETFHQVMPGDGFFVAAKRAVFATIVLMGSERNKVHVHSTLASVLDKCAHRARHDTFVAMQRLADLETLRASA